MMVDYFKDMLYKKCLVLLDDVIIFGKTVDETLDNYGEFCKKVRSVNLKLKPSKCALFQTQVSFLGHVISEKGVSTDPEKVKSVQHWLTPKKRKEVRRFLGLVRYYRKFIPNFSSLAKPLTALTSPRRMLINIFSIHMRLMSACRVQYFLKYRMVEKL